MALKLAHWRWGSVGSKSDAAPTKSNFNPPDSDISAGFSFGDCAKALERISGEGGRIRVHPTVTGLFGATNSHREANAGRIEAMSPRAT